MNRSLHESEKKNDDITDDPRKTNHSLLGMNGVYQCEKFSSICLIAKAEAQRMNLHVLNMTLDMW